MKTALPRRPASPALPALMALLLLAVLLPACTAGLKQAAPQRQYLLLQAPNPGCPGVATGSAQRSGVLAVRDLSASPGFTGREFVYRLGEHEWQTDYYKQFLSAPAPMVSQAARGALATSGPYATVLAPGVDAAPDDILEGQLTALYADFRGPGHGEAVVALQFFLLRETPTGGVPVFQKSFEGRAPLKSRDFEALSAAWHQALEQALCALRAELAQVKKR